MWYVNKLIVSPSADILIKRRARSVFVNSLFVTNLRRNPIYVCVQVLYTLAQLGRVMVFANSKKNRDFTMLWNEFHINEIVCWINFAEYFVIIKWLLLSRQTFTWTIFLKQTYCACRRLKTKQNPNVSVCFSSLFR